MKEIFENNKKFIIKNREFIYNPRVIPSKKNQHSRTKDFLDYTISEIEYNCVHDYQYSDHYFNQN